MNARLHIEKHAFRHRMAILLLMVAFAFPIGMIAQDTGRLDTLKSQIRFLEIQLDTTISPKDTTGFFKSIFQVFKFRENRKRVEKDRFNEIIKEKIEILTIEMDSLEIVQSTDKTKKKPQVTGTGLPKTNEAESKKTGDKPYRNPPTYHNIGSLHIRKGYGRLNETDLSGFQV